MVHRAREPARGRARLGRADGRGHVQEHVRGGGLGEQAGAVVELGLPGRRPLDPQPRARGDRPAQPDAGAVGGQRRRQQPRDVAAVRELRQPGVGGVDPELARGHLRRPCARGQQVLRRGREPVGKAARGDVRPLAELDEGGVQRLPAPGGREPLARLEHRAVVVGHERDEPVGESPWNVAVCRSKASSTPSPSNSERTWSSSPHRGGGLAPAGGAGRCGDIVAKSCPMKPAGVQLASTIVPPGRVTRRDLAGAHGMARRADLHAEHGEHACRSSRRRTAAPRRRPRPSRSRTPAFARAPRRVEQPGDEVEPGHARARQGGGDRGVAGARRDVEHLGARRDPRRGDRRRADVLHEGLGDGAVVAGRPGRAVGGLQLPDLEGGGHAVRSFQNT